MAVLVIGLLEVINVQQDRGQLVTTIQAVWLAGLVVFALAATAAALRATWLLVSGRRAELDRAFGPRSTSDEVEEELEDLKARSNEPLPARVEGARA